MSARVEMRENAEMRQYQINPWGHTIDLVPTKLVLVEMRENDFEIISIESIPGGVEQGKIQIEKSIPEALDPEFDNIIVTFN